MALAGASPSCGGATPSLVGSLGRATNLAFLRRGPLTVEPSAVELVRPTPAGPAVAGGGTGSERGAKLSS